MLQILDFVSQKLLSQIFRINICYVSKAFLFLVVSNSRRFGLHKLKMTHLQVELLSWNKNE